jgi:hypothetical protein
VILLDSSAWVAYLRGEQRAEVVRHIVSDPTTAACTEPVLMEVLGGSRSAEEFVRVRRLLLNGRWVTADTSCDFEAAARTYAACRSIGVTPRGFIDCMIAVIAVRTRTPLLALDRDFRGIARVVDLELHPLSA